MTQSKRDYTIKKTIIRDSVIDEYEITELAVITSVLLLAFETCMEAINFANWMIKNDRKEIEGYRNQRTLSLCEKLKSEAYGFFDKYTSVIGKGYHSYDQFEASASMNEVIESEMKPLSNELSDVLRSELLKDFRPLDPNAATKIIHLLFVSSMFCDVRFSFKTLSEDYKELFRSLKIRDTIRKILVEMHLYDRSGKEFLFIFNKREYEDWKIHENKKSFRGRKISELIEFNFYYWICKPQIDYLQYKYYVKIFSSDTVERVYAAGHGGKKCEYKKRFGRDTVTECLSDYDQFCVYNSMYDLDFRDALYHLKKMKEKFSEPVIKFKFDGKNATFSSIYCNIDEAAFETQSDKKDIKASLEYNNKMEMTSRSCMMLKDSKHIFYRYDVFVEFLEYLSSKQGKYNISKRDIEIKYSSNEAC